MRQTEEPTMAAEEQQDWNIEKWKEWNIERLKAFAGNLQEPLLCHLSFIIQRSYAALKLIVFMPLFGVGIYGCILWWFVFAVVVFKEVGVGLFDVGG